MIPIANRKKDDDKLSMDLFLDEEEKNDAGYESG
jgi:hypothetical protein